MKVVVNAAPLIAFALLHHLDLLQELFQQVFVPVAGYQ